METSFRVLAFFLSVYLLCSRKWMLPLGGLSLLRLHESGRPSRKGRFQLEIVNCSFLGFLLPKKKYRNHNFQEHCVVCNWSDQPVPVSIAKGL